MKLVEWHGFGRSVSHPLTGFPDRLFSSLPVPAKPAFVLARAGMWQFHCLLKPCSQPTPAFLSSSSSFSLMVSIALKRCTGMELVRRHAQSTLLFLLIPEESLFFSSI